MTEIREQHPDGHRLLWQTTGVGLAIFAIFWGLGYVVNGNRYAVSQPALYIARQAPGHMHSIGVLSFLVGCWLLCEVLYIDHFYRRRSLWAFTGMCAGMTVCVIGAWGLTGEFTWTAPWSFVAFLIIAGGMMVYPPPPNWRGGTGA